MDRLTPEVAAIDAIAPTERWSLANEDVTVTFVLTQFSDKSLLLIVAIIIVSWTP